MQWLTRAYSNPTSLLGDRNLELFLKKQWYERQTLRGCPAMASRAALRSTDLDSTDQVTDWVLRDAVLHTSQHWSRVSRVYYALSWRRVAIICLLYSREWGLGCEITLIYSSWLFTRNGYGRCSLGDSLVLLYSLLSNISLSLGPWASDYMSGSGRGSKPPTRRSGEHVPDILHQLNWPCPGLVALSP